MCKSLLQAPLDVEVELQIHLQNAQVAKFFNKMLGHQFELDSEYTFAFASTFA
jgi:hypothetical protein